MKNKKKFIIYSLVIIIGLALAGFLLADAWCNDTDGGENLSIAGSCTDSCGGPYYDSCPVSSTAQNNVLEYFCNSDICTSSWRYCPTNQCCFAGRCYTKTGTCTDADGLDTSTKNTCVGLCDYDIKTDTCFGDRVWESYCNGSNCEKTIIECPDGEVCENGICVVEDPEDPEDPGDPFCDDTDPTDDLWIGGTCIDDDGEWSDREDCIGVHQFFCPDCSHSFYEECPNGQCAINDINGYGICDGIPGNANDTDGGKITTTKGSCTDACSCSGGIDYCVEGDPHTVMEYSETDEEHCTSEAMPCPIGTCCDNGACSADNCFSEPPTVSNLHIVSRDYCNSSENKTLITFGWTYSSPENIPQLGYDLKIRYYYNNKWWDVLIENREHPKDEDNTAGVYIALTPEIDELHFIRSSYSYSWNVVVYDIKGNSSGKPVSGGNFSGFYPYPYPDFSWDPTRPTIENEVEFIDETIFPYSGYVKSWRWSIDGVQVSSSQPMSYIFDESKNYTVQLKACAGPHYATNCCTEIKTVEVKSNQFFLPSWFPSLPF